jgi:hypothetical protein
LGFIIVEDIDSLTPLKLLKPSANPKTVSIMANVNLSHRPKISPEFATRLMTLEPQQKIRIIVLLQIPETENKTVAIGYVSVA